MKRIKAVAMYLPQFHRVKENDEWWGEGFTEWTTVKTADILFEGHNQKRIPYCDNYYDLLQKETMQWQAELAGDYGIEGFCFYHYYFKDGRKILETPAENLLKWKDINMPFCFCWANETWARTWSNILGVNAWSEKFEVKTNDGKAILLEQDYGNEEIWEKHFEYLYSFFEDDRYIRINDKPVFVLYKPNDVHCFSEMIECWNELMRKKGGQGVYVIGVNTVKKMKGMDAILYQAPNAYINVSISGKDVKDELIENVKVYDYDAIYANALSVKGKEDICTYFGSFVDYDDTPRRGKLGWCTKNVSPDKFEEHLYNMAVKNMAVGNELLFINAWNEWGEGNYLEPDQKHEYGYLQAVRNVIDKCSKFVKTEDVEEEWKKIKESRDCGRITQDNSDIVKKINKFHDMFKILDRWLLLKEKQCSIVEFFKNYDYGGIMIYGYGALGRHLYEELRETSIQTIAIMDRREGLTCQGVKVLKLEEDIPECDAIIVTAIDEFEEIKEMLSQRTTVKIISLQEVIFYSYKLERGIK